MIPEGALPGATPAGSLTAGAGPRLPRWRQSVLLGALAAAVALAWAYLHLHSAHQDAAMAEHLALGMSLPPWTAGQAALTLAMWAVMMVAMMLPSAAPAVLTFAAVSSRLSPGSSGLPIAAFFVAGYLIVWSGFSLAATALQWALGSLNLLGPMMAKSGTLLGVALLILAGLYQLGPLKDVCVQACRTPLQFIATHWREGRGGALRLGLRHGVYCVGCCWALMLLLFVGGVMNLLWVAVISVFVLAEKLTAAGSRIGRWVSGGGLILAAGVLALA